MPQAYADGKLMQAAQMKVFEGKNYEEIASELGLNAGTLRNSFSNNATLIGYVDQFKGAAYSDIENQSLKAMRRAAKYIGPITKILIRIALGEEINGKHPSISIQLSAINTFLDRMGMSRVSKSESTRTHSVEGFSNGERGAIVNAMVSRISGKKNTHIEPENVQTIELSDSSQNDNDQALQEVIEEPTKNLT